MASPTILAALDTFQRAANRGTAVYLSPELVQELRDALKAEPEPGEVGQLVEWLKEEAEAYRNTCGTNLASQNLGNAATLLQQLAALRGVPVSERLPGEGDCDAEGRCWCFAYDGRLRSWTLRIIEPGIYDTHWLPAHAIPLPQAGEAQP